MVVGVHGVPSWGILYPYQGVGILSIGGYTLMIGVAYTRLRLIEASCTWGMVLSRETVVTLRLSHFVMDPCIATLPVMPMRSRKLAAVGQCRKVARITTPRNVHVQNGISYAERM